MSAGSAETPQLLAAGGGDKIARLWSLSTGALRTTLAGHSNGVMSLALRPDGKTLATAHGMFGNYLRLWNLADGKLLRTVLIVVLRFTSLDGAILAQVAT